MCRARQPVTRNSLKSDVAAGPVEIDPLYLFLCAVKCSKRGSGEAAWELLGALTSTDPATRSVARVLLNRC
jgi:hypothetical protein